MSLASVVCLSVCPNLDSDFHFAMRLKSLKSKCIKKTLNMTSIDIPKILKD